MSYTAITAAAVAGCLIIDLLVLRTRLVSRRAFWVAYAIVLAFQLAINGLLAGLPVVRYAPETILGPRIARAPVEDIGFGFAMVLLTLSMWVWLGRREADRRDPRSRDQSRRRDRRDQSRRARPAASSRPTASARRAGPTDTRRSSTR